MNKALSIMYLFPNANPRSDFIVQNDSNGNGDYISVWNLAEPQPTEEELQIAWVAYELAESLKPIPKTKLEVLQEQVIKNQGAIDFIIMNF